MSKRKPKQIGFDAISYDFAVAMLPSHVVTIDTRDGDIGRIVREMLEVPTDKNILLDYWVGHQPGEPSQLDGEYAELLRLQYMLNYRVRGQRFDFLGDSFLNRMIKKSITERLWDVGDFPKED